MTESSYKTYGKTLCVKKYQFGFQSSLFWKPIYLLIALTPRPASLGAAEGIELRRSWRVVVRLVVSIFRCALERPPA
jgi:hypothetical protein